MNILDSLNSAWTSLMNNLSDIYYRSKYGLDISPEDDLWFDQITNVTAPAVEKVVSSGNKVKEALLSIPRAVKYILIGAGVLAIIFLISNIRKKWMAEFFNFLSLLSLLIIPVLKYVMDIEKRLTRLEILIQGKKNNEKVF